MQVVDRLEQPRKSKAKRKKSKAREEGQPEADGAQQLESVHEERPPEYEQQEPEQEGKRNGADDEPMRRLSNALKINL